MTVATKLKTVEDALNELDKPVSHPSLADAMTAAFAEIEGATKAATNPHFKSKYADLTSIIEAIKPPLIRHGLFFTQRCQPSEDGVCVETVLHHAGGEKESLGTLYVPANKRDAQGFGSALTYARRYALQTAFGVPTEDDDGNAAVAGARAANGHANGNAITEDQWLSLDAKADAVGADKEKLAKYLGAASLRELPANRYNDALAALEAKAKKNGDSHAAH